MANIAEWVSALGALGALAAAIWAGITSVKLFGVETDRDEAARVVEERRQASSISAWCTYRESAGIRGILIRNSSGDPVHEVTIHSTYAIKKSQNGSPQAPLELSLLPPGDYIAEAEPTYHWTFPEHIDSVDGTVRPIMKNPQWTVTSIRFTDAQGMRWERRGGRLEKIEA